MYEKLRAMNRDKVIRVFDATIERKNTSRTVISKDTGLSFVTVSKIVDALIEENILKQTFTDRSTVLKRRSRLVNAKQKYWIGVYVIHPNKYTFSMLDLNSECIKSYIHYPKESIFVDDLLLDFLIRTERFIRQNAKVSNCCGIGVLVPGDYDPEKDKVPVSDIPHLGAIRIKELFSRYSFDHEPFVISLYSSCAEEIKRTLPSDRQALALFLNIDSIKTAYITPENNSKVFVKDLGPLKSSSGRRFSSIVRIVPEPGILFKGLADVIFTLLHTIQLSDIIICGYLYKHSYAVPLVMNQYLIDLCTPEKMRVPDIKSEDLDTLAQKNISRVIWHKWLTETVLSPDKISDNS